MPQRIIPFVNGYYYHIFNRGSEKRTIYENKRDYWRFQKTIQYYQIEGPKPRFSKFPSLACPKLDHSKKIVELAAFCLMPNHFHLLIKQTKEYGITHFISQLSNSYTKYYNIKHNRVGPLLQGEFKAVLIESDEQLVHVSRYIHLNPISSLLVKDLSFYPWSSYNEYINNTGGICTKDDILSHFKDIKDYQQFVLDQASYAVDLEFIKHQLIDINYE